MNGLTRRSWLNFAAGSVGASILTGCHDSPEAVSAPAAERTAGSEQDAWAYRRLDPMVVGQRVYSIYPEGGCMYALFGGILLGVSDKCGEALSSFPLHMMKYGAGGVGGWGTLCGALNGAAAAIGLFVADKQRREELIGELFSWYESESLPKYRPTTSDKHRAIVGTTAESVLCHVSVGKWCHASGSKVESIEKTERCRRLTADVCMRTVELLNRYVSAGKTTAEGSLIGLDAPQSRPAPSPAEVMGKMRCDTCHVPQENNGKSGALFKERKE
jgi:hypothetical protein